MSRKNKKIAQYERALATAERQTVKLVRARFAKLGIPCDSLVSEMREAFAQGTAPIPPEADRRPAASIDDDDDDDEGKETTDDDDKGKETTDDDSASDAGDPAPAMTVDGKLLELLPLLTKNYDRGKRIAVKAPEMYGGEKSEFRLWWRKIKDYFDINTPSLPTDKIKIQTVGTFLKGTALSWYQQRRGELKASKTKDTWRQFKAAMEDRFTDHMEMRKDWRKMRQLRYKGDIQEYLSKLLEINGRVGAKGEPLREVITAAMTPEMHRAIYQRYRRLPVDDKELIAAVRDVGIIEEEIALSRAQIQKMKKMGLEDSDDEEEKKKGKKKKKDKQKVDKGKKGKEKEPEKRKDKSGKRDPKSSNVPIDFSALKRVWDTPFQALKGIKQEQIDKFKEAEKDCIRCGYDGHRTVHCYRKKDADGNTLPPAPKDKKDKAAASATKRKRGDSSSSDSSSSSAESESESEPEQKTKPHQKRIKGTASGARRKGIEGSKEVKRIHAAAAAKAQQDHWFEDESEAELGSDF